MRNKLIGLIYNATLDCRLKDGEKKPVRIVDSGAGTAYLADCLLAHGVTMQEWVSVEERLPQEGEMCCVVTEQGVKYAAYHGEYGWEASERGYSFHVDDVKWWCEFPALPKEK